MLYWTGEFVKVFIGYFVLMYLWPLVVFRKKMHGKSRTFCFAFCSTVSVMLINLVVLGLGLFHILNRWIVVGIFYGIFLCSLLKKKQYRAYIINQIQCLVSGSLGWKWFFLCLFKNGKDFVSNCIKSFIKRIEGRKLEYVMLIILIFFGISYFSYGAFQCHSYAWGDMYVHHEWIYGLKQGQIFSAGIYPEAMHCFVYMMNALFGIRVYSCMLYLGGIHVSTLLIAVYCLFKEVMRSRYTAYLILAIFLTIDVVSPNEIYGMARLQNTIPQEFGMYTQFLCALYLIRFLRRKQDSNSKKRESIFHNEDLFLFASSLAVSFAIHFYITIMAFFLCLSFVIFGISKVFRRKSFQSLVVAVLFGIFVSAVPMVAAFASGIPLQGSLGWGVNVMKGTDTQEAESHSSGEDIRMHNKNVTKAAKKSLGKRMTDVARIVYRSGYVTLYKTKRARWIVQFTGIAAVLAALNWIIQFIYMKKFTFEMYFGITFASVLFMILYAAPFLGLPEIIASSRLCSTEQILILAMIAIPVDELFWIFGKTKVRVLLPHLSLLCVSGIYVGTNFFGMYHGYLYYELSRYNEVVDTTNNIIGQYPENSYTIISTTDDLYQLIEFGRHEEIFDFFQKSEKKNYFIPTKYLFFYIEKRPFKRNQLHFFTGPRWLAQAKYKKYYKYFDRDVSEGNDVKCAKISDNPISEEDIKSVQYSEAYDKIQNRILLESKMYDWCKNFKEKFPNEMKVYYENSHFVCYRIIQNPERLYNLEDEDVLH